MKAIGIGRLTKDIELKHSQSGTAYMQNSIACDRRFKKDGETETDWFSCVCFNKQAEFVDKYLKQGSRIGVVGRIENDNYTNKEGQKVYGMKVMVDEIEFAESKNAESKPADKPNDDFMAINEAELDTLPYIDYFLKNGTRP